ncbi:MAG: VWA domain-containing protein [Clostridiales bacterium]|nr:VWA domain-containing protein [Clostridiales bacterium]
MKKPWNVVIVLLCSVLICASVLLLSKNAFSPKAEVELQIDTGSKEYQVGDQFQISLEAKNTGRSDMNNVELELILPDEIGLRQNSPEQTRSWNSLSSGNVLSTFVYTEALSEADEDSVVNEETSFLSKVDSISTKIAPFAAIFAVLGLIIVFVISKEGRILMAVSLTVAILGGFLAPTIYYAITSGEFSYEERITQSFSVAGKTATIEGVIRYNKEEPVSETNEYYLVYNSNGGNEVAFQKVNENELATVPEFPSKDGFDFTGWYLDEECKNQFDFDSQHVTEDIILYAGWVDERYGWDSDGDGITNILEKKYGSDPFVFNDTNIDFDGDLIPDYAEQYIFKTSYQSKDTDGDQLSDYDELMLTLTDPTLPDSDSDGVDDYSEDADADSLSNGEEIAINTSPLVADSDADGLNDSKEVKELKTDPLESDSDGDQASDGWEANNGTDPLAKNDKFDISATETSSDGKVTATVDLSLAGDPEAVTFTESDVDQLLDETIPGCIGAPFILAAEGAFAEATVKFSFDSGSIPQDAELTICVYNEDTGLLDPIPTTIEGNIASGTVYHSSTMVLLNKRQLDDVWANDILSPDSEAYKESVFDIAFVIDYSASMDDNDPDRLRIEIVKQFISKLRDGQDQASVIKFAKYATVLVPLSKDKTLLTNTVDSITNASSDGCDDEAGTNGSDGLHAALEELKASSSEGDFKYIIFLTDGEDNNTSYDYDVLIQDAIDNNITIFSIGMGEADETLLKRIAESTGGKYYYATAVDLEDTSQDGLMDAFHDIEVSTLDLETDSNNDGISDYYTKLLCEGKLRTGTGIPLFEGISYDEVQSSDDYDQDGVPNGEEVIVKYDAATGKTYIAVVSSPTNPDTDGDGVKDGDDPEPRKKGLEGGVIGKLTLVSCYEEEDSGWTSGHAFFVYTSYINDSIDFTGLVPGWQRRDRDSHWSTSNIVRDSSATDSYIIEVGESVAIGDGAAGAGFDSLINDRGSIIDRGDTNGVSYNMEVRKHYSSDYSYLHNTYISMDITEKDLRSLISFCGRSDVCFWSLTHNCATVAAQAWNRLSDEKVNPYSFDFMRGDVATPKGLKEDLRKNPNHGEDFDFIGTLGL